MSPGALRDRFLPAAVTVAGAAATLAAVASRAVHYAGWGLPEALNRGLGQYLAVTFSLILVQLTGLLPVSFGLAALLFVLRYRWPGTVLRVTEQGWRTRLWVHGLLWIQIYSMSFLLDLDPRLAWSFGAGVALHLLLASLRGRRLFPSSRAPWLAWLGLFLVLAPFQEGWVDRLSVGLWCGVQPWLTSVLSRASSWHDRLWPAVLSVMVGQLLASSIPYLLYDPAPILVLGLFLALRYALYRFVGRPRRWWWRVPLAAAGLLVALHFGWELGQRHHLEGRGTGGTLLGTDLAYNFCESPERRRLAVTVPICSGPGGPDCVLGRIDLFDLDSLEQVDTLRPFDARFSGRMEQIVCQEDRLLVGMCCASPGEQHDRLAVMSIDWSGQVLEQSLLPERETNRVLPDPDGAALWLAGSDLVHLDLRTHEAKLLASRPPPGIFVVERGSASARRDSVFVGEFINGSSVRELDRRSLETKRRIETYNGSVVAVTVDDPMGRLWVTGLWGVDVFDLESGERVASERLGFASRTPFVDELRGLVYIPATTSGKVYVLDREDARYLGALTIGFGPRNVFLADGGRWFVTSSEHGLWYWDAAELASRFKAPPVERASGP